MSPRLVVIIAVVIIWVAVGCGDGTQAPTPALTQTPAAAEPTPPPPPPTPEEMIAAQDKLADAIKLVRVLMEDTVENISPSAYLMAQWMAAHLNWDELKALESTKYKLVMKDPEMERGKLLCAKVKIVQIQREREAPFQLYWGVMNQGWSNTIYYYAVGSTGELVEDSRTTFCGVVIGTHSYSNLGGGTTIAVLAVGMFDLEENRAIGKPTK